MLPFDTMIALDRSERTPVYMQIVNKIINHISYGNIVPTFKMPGTRKMAEMLGVNRRTIIVAYEELEAQGWLEVRRQSGYFVSDTLPIISPQEITHQVRKESPSIELKDYDSKWPFISHTQNKSSKVKYIIDAGYPDTRLAPLKELGRNISSLLSAHNSVKLMDYGNDFQGDYRLREELVNHLALTRSISIDISQIMITRGSLMAFYLLFQLIVEEDEYIITGAPGFHVADSIIKLAKGRILQVSVDSQGLMTDQIEKLCQSYKVKAVFAMPHHHNPTTVSLSADRRMHLLRLAEEHDFIIIEDDYDYDFHYDSSPILPMACSDRQHRVIYVGSLSKTVAPGLRLGYITASAHLIKNLIRLSRHIDCHGNTMLERSVAYLFAEGLMLRYFKKALKQYRLRRDHFCNLLHAHLGDSVSFQVPAGGLAVWVNFNSSIDLISIRDRALDQGLQITRAHYKNSDGETLNAIRMGFASLSIHEAEEAIKILKEVIKSS